jgi:hypothetical protein
MEPEERAELVAERDRLLALRERYAKDLARKKKAIVRLRTELDYLHGLISSAHDRAYDAVKHLSTVIAAAIAFVIALMGLAKPIALWFDPRQVATYLLLALSSSLMAQFGLIIPYDRSSKGWLYIGFNALLILILPVNAVLTFNYAIYLIIK